MYPLLMLTTSQRTGHSYADHAVGIQTGASSVGAAAVPAMIGVLVGQLGVSVIGVCMVVITLIAETLLHVSTRLPTHPETHLPHPRAPR
jgi:predicted MFS family arabinose efflux permease